MLQVSGVLAVVDGRLVVGCRARRASWLRHPRARASGTWQMVIFVVNGLAFLLDRPPAADRPRRARGLPGRRASWSTWRPRSASTVIVVRLVWVFPATYLPRWLIPSLDGARPGAAAAGRAHPRLGRHARGGLAGRRPGAAAADAPRPVARTRPGDLSSTFAVILVTLVGQGLTLPWLIRRLGVVRRRLLAARGDPRPGGRPTDAALVRLEELAEPSAPGHMPLIDQLRERYEHRSRAPGASSTATTRAEIASLTTGDDRGARARRDPAGGHRAPSASRSSSCVTAAVIGDIALRAVERDLDLDELRREA